MSYRIASFNLNNLSRASGHDLDRIAAIINENQLDIVAMQEILSEGNFFNGNGITQGNAKFLKYRLRGNWEFQWRDPKVNPSNYPYLGKDNRGEGYAFLWNTDKFELLKDRHGDFLRPQIWSNYKINSDENRIRLIRDPCYGRFKVKNMKAEIRLITTHIISKKPKTENIAVNLDVGAINMRRNEFYILAGDIYRRISDHRKDVNSNASYTIILGDYNLNLKSSGLVNATIPDVVFFDRDGKMSEIPATNNRCIYTVQSEPTTLKRNDIGYANNFDHFSYDERVKNSIIKSVYRIDAVHENIESGDTTEDQMFATYKEKVSDHVPVVIEIDFK